MKQIQPADIARSGTELANQQALFCWAALNYNKYPQLKFMYHVPNGGQRSKITGAQLKAAGVRAGVPDIHLPLKCGQYSGLFIELKVKAGKASDSQENWLAYLNGAGYYATVCVGWEQAVACLEWYLKLER